MGAQRRPHKSEKRVHLLTPLVLLAQITTLENQLRKSEGAKVDQEILRTLLMKVPVLYFLILLLHIFSFLFELIVVPCPAAAVANDDSRTGAVPESGVVEPRLRVCV